ncbi:glycosyltransferase [Bacteroides fragilis]|uniref:glycosyltransferase family 2 protein n=1 Tax=Bacteroides fragilis TaxID=817 RepID=UPI00202F16B6|nr:glycosyltransferase family 2 protein [Bacteroides fragilis]MCM0237090.1 glycosyltransferase [Bacteroides fragilis]
MYKYKLSIITVNYNNVKGLVDTIESVVNQTNQDFEYIIIDGGSTDGSVDVIKEYTNKIDYWISEKDNGIYHAMNKGVRMVSCEYCIFMNSGDVFYSNDVIAQVYNKGLSADIVTGITSIVFNGLKTWWIPPLNVDFSFFYTTTLSHQGSFIKASILKENLYDERYKIASDWKFFLYALIVLKYSYKSINVIVSRSDTVGVSSNLSLANFERKNILENMFPENILMEYKKKCVNKNGIKRRIGEIILRNRYLNRLYQTYVYYHIKKNISRY